MKVTIAIIAIVIIGGGAWLLLSDNTTEEATTNTVVTNTNTTVSTNTNLDLEIEDDTIQYQFSGLVMDVSGGIGIGEVKANFEDGTYALLATFENLPDPEGTDFYEGWIVRNFPSSVISTGAATITKGEGIYKNIYSFDQDLTDHDFYVLTLEPDDGDPAPATHILEGTLKR